VPRREVLPAPVLVVGAVASVQSGAAIATRLFPMVGPAGAVFLRLALSAVLVAALARPRIRSIPRRHLALGAFFGLVLAAMNLSFYLALDRVPLGVGVTVEFLGPLAVAIAGSRRALDLLWVGLAVVGVVLIAGVGGPHHGEHRTGGRLDIVGILLAALAGGFWAGYILLSQRVGRVLPGMTGLAIALTVGAVAVAPAGILAGGTALVRPNVLGRGAAIAVLSSAVPYSLELAALRRLKASVFSVLMSLEPAMGAISGLVFLGQHLRWQEWLAVACVMTASIGATTHAPNPTGPDVPLAECAESGVPA
jgi:inner membrane transporter RhtA